MNTCFLSRSIGLLALVAGLGLAKVHAQETAIGIRINGLTTDERDALVRDLRQQGELRVGFACVPAGILLLEPTGRAALTPEGHTAAIRTVRQRIAGARISEEPLTMATAEERCAEARNR
ncbi:MAG: hypothetical protein QM724_13575 [Flavobacteriales bacterium]